MKQEFKSGFVALAGRPNVGKSSLFNTLIGEKIAITSEKPQTTRYQLRGILTGSDYQIVWIDTPGFHRPLHELGSQMIEAAQDVLASVDLVLWILDANTGMTTADLKVANILSGVKPPVFVVWNKLDLIPAERELEPIPDFERVFKISTLNGAGMDELLAAVVTALPSGPAFYPSDQLTDQSERVIVSELIREQVLKFTEDEVPHSVAVLVQEMKERPNDKIYIEATIFVERDSQKGIVIGANGSRLKQIGQAAREDIQQLLGTSVYLSLWVKTRPKWRDSKAALKEFGYWSQSTHQKE